jgi:uncharacterized membrane protein YkoI
MKNDLKVLVGMLTVLGVAVSGILFGLSSVLQPVVAQVNDTTSSPAAETANRTEKSQQVNITGSIPLQSTINQALRSEIQVLMSEAITTAQNTAGGNSSVVAAFLSPLKGFLVYNIGVMSANNTLYKVIVDPGNGEVLYTSEGRQLNSFHQLMSGPFGHGMEFGDERGFGHGGQFGDWKGHGRGYGQGGGEFWHNR